MTQNNTPTQPDPKAPVTAPRLWGFPPRVVGMLFMIASSVGISFGGLIVRSVKEADAWDISFYRSVGYAVTVGAVLFWRYRARSGRQILAVGAPGILAAAFSACAGMAFLQSLVHSDVATTLFIMAAIPFVTALFAWVVLRETLTRATGVTMVVAAIGVGIMVQGGFAGGAKYGTAMAMVTVLCFSGYATVLRRQRHLDMIPVLMLSGLFLATLAALVKGGDLVIPLHDILLCLLLGMVLSGLGNLLFLAASRVLAAAELTLFMLFEFALGPVWVWIFLSENPSRAAIQGGALVILAVLLRTWWEMSGQGAQGRQR